MKQGGKSSKSHTHLKHLISKNKTIKIIKNIRETHPFCIKSVSDSNSN